MHTHYKYLDMSHIKLRGKKDAEDGDNALRLRLRCPGMVICGVCEDSNFGGSWGIREINVSSTGLFLFRLAGG